MAEKNDERTLECKLVAKHFVFDTDNGEHFDYWAKFVRIGKTDVPITLKKGDTMAKAYLHDKLGIED